MQFQRSKRPPCVKRGALRLSVCNIGAPETCCSQRVFFFYNRFKGQIHKKVRFVQRTITYCYHFNNNFLFLYENY